MPLFLLVLLGVAIYIGYVYSKQGGVSPPSTEERIGAEGEYLVQVELNKLPRQSYVVFNDILLGNGKYTQVDHVVVSPYGVFVIETKNYGGQVYGHLNASQWTHVTRRNKHKFYNPLKQNEAHISAINKAVGYDLGDKIHSVVVFVRQCELHIDATNNVLMLPQLLGYLSKYNRQVFTPVQVEHIVCAIRNSVVYDQRARQEHKQQVKRKQQAAQSPFNLLQGKCPMCGGSLQKRTGKYGNFYGCSNYPRCRYTRK